MPQREQWGNCRFRREFLLRQMYRPMSHDREELSPPKLTSHSHRTLFPTFNATFRRVRRDRLEAFRGM